MAEFILCGNNLAAFEDTDSREMLVAGPAGTGKTLANLAKLLYFGDTYPRARMLIARKTRHSLTETALVTWERDVLGEGHPIISRPIERSHRHAYKFPNGSVLVTGGLDKPDKVLSSEWDIIYCPEGTELELTDWETLGGRLRANAGPYDQLIADCNPGAPTHWLYKRCLEQKCKLYPTTHRDNPRYYDYEARRWTDAGKRYLARLDQLTGPRRKRFLEGIWAQAEGVVYDNWDQSEHVIARRPIPPDWARYLSIDFGYTNPFVCQWWAEDGDGRMYLYREMYRTRMLVEDAARQIKAIMEGEVREVERELAKQIEAENPPDKMRRLAEVGSKARRCVLPRAVVCDHDAEDRATLQRHLGLGTTPAQKGVEVGIQLVTARLSPAGDGKPRLFVFRDALASRDPYLDEAKKPCGLVEEIDGYIWDVREGKPPREEPVKADDHSCDAMRYMVAHRDWPRPTPNIR